MKATARPCARVCCARNRSRGLTGANSSRVTQVITRINW